MQRLSLTLQGHSQAGLPWRCLRFAYDTGVAAEPGSDLGSGPGPSPGHGPDS